MNINFSNKKKIIISIISILIIAIPIIAAIFFSTSIPQPMEIVSNDGSFKLIIPGQIKYERKETDTLDIYSTKDEMVITSNIIAKEKEINLQEIVSSEMTNLPNTRNSAENISDLNKIDSNKYEAYKYTYSYFDEEYNDIFYTEVVWISTDKNIYVLDLEVITKNQDKYKPLFNNIINSFEEINVY